jgi:hypothetical protein
MKEKPGRDPRVFESQGPHPALRAAFFRKREKGFRPQITYDFSGGKPLKPTAE